MNDGSVHRRGFLRIGGAAAVSGLSAAGLSSTTIAANSKTRVAALSEIRPWQPISFAFPTDAPAILLDIGTAVPGGVGPQKSIVAFSALCQHMGCPVSLDEKSREIVCPCHASRFDPKRAGMATAGPATRGLPQIAVTVEGGVVYAVGFSDGVVYSYACDA